MLSLLVISLRSPPILILLCCLLLLIVRKSIKRAFLLKDIPLSKIKSAAQGYVEVRGAAAPLSDTIISPLSNKACCWYSYVIEVEFRNGWRTIAKYISGHCFKLNDSTGEVIIYPHHADISNINQYQWIQYGLKFKNENTHTRFFSTLFHFLVDHRYRITEQRILEDEKITALGYFKTIGTNGNPNEIKLSEDKKDGILKKIKKELSKLNQLVHLRTAIIKMARENLKLEEKDWDYIQEINQDKNVNILYKHDRDFILSPQTQKNLSQKYRKRFFWVSATFIILIGWTAYAALKYGILHVG